MNVILGVDAGGTSSRAAAVTTEGAALGRGRAGGGNPVALGVEKAFANLALAVRAALAPVDPARVKAVTVGLAGSGMLRDPAVRSALERTLRGCGLAAVPRVVGDVVVAFAAGTAARSGTVLISGTGAVAAQIIDHEPVALADGYGWLLGDEGSAFWLGRAAARAAVRQAGSGLPMHDAGLLTRLVVGHLLPAAVRGGEGGEGGEIVVPGGELADLLCAAVQIRHPLALAELAPLVSRAALAGDPAAEAVVAGAAARLARTVSRVHVPGPCTPIVLAGSVLTSEGPVRRAVQDLLRRRGSGPVAVAGDGAGAAAWLAAGPLLGPGEAAGLHHRFTGALQPGNPSASPQEDGHTGQES
ncbi:ATPase [Planomonospora sp. ID67723]|uniref:BadF/BadG/BcrA/BcrD ATPase family protein n=1 Tax=Planomonospora sp. ID67723 TaxID=2738134 RepID=UPI0018C4253D|nr:BadF/BadG/BcrA/BcrD ATPase family protein [Planomonospora sp. ID67723]MBG0830242.1 ATPase [Planomonospora sp. ID67723]